MSDLDFLKNNSVLDENRGIAIAIGNFDGFHQGHREIIDTLKTIASEKNRLSMIVMITPNPKVYFNPSFQLIHTDAQKKKILEEQSVDLVSIIDFNRIANMSNEEFLRDILIQKYNMKSIVMGENFRFGKDREGDIEFIKEASKRYGFDFTVAATVMLDGVRISSTYIRERLAHAEIEESNRMLGRKYMIEGIVIEGDKVGRQLGFPTINIETENTLLPEGVFKTSVEIETETFDSITYIGYRPTFKGREKKVETHIFDFDRKVYGKSVKLYFEKKVRDEMKFESENSLVMQIRRDIEKLKVDKDRFF
jgi:riboflavin kinase / FMN adenylyltransferase